ncbi:hypothetical protein B0A54_16218 [Friedmanniomyces endolithicus]|uniref:Uncharacterized protein n=1 Tax=Friedmanniomyces endolithicus TaxID=329885 RepID=A0A4U0U2J2_9PEZI|nr:hypothetical protein B0A54_16218 [Friedmanniomyces endolithicus]
MRLLHLTSLEFQEFYGESIPPYAILSHRWGEGEVSYKDMRKKRNLEGPGFAKVQGFCNFARSNLSVDSVIENEDGTEPGWNESTLKWGWIDACCIDSSSSAELTEAINFMFQWYRNSEFCCVHLADVTSTSEIYVAREFEASEWFTRGWTLQELLAPRDVLFCNAQWTLIGHKCIHNPSECSSYDAAMPLNKEIATATNIHPKYLTSANAYAEASIACRMSWAAHRKTTRIEDVAYCLLGLFGVHLPPLYGEGENAFRRLQEELLRRSNDQSIFAWFNVNRYLLRYDMPELALLATPILASHPTDFSTSGNVESLQRAPDTPYSLTNTGLELRTRLKRYRASGSSETFYTLQLNCSGGQRVQPFYYYSGNTTMPTQLVLLDVCSVAGTRGGINAQEIMRAHVQPAANFSKVKHPYQGGETDDVQYVKSEGDFYGFMQTPTGLVRVD